MQFIVMPLFDHSLQINAILKVMIIHINRAISWVSRVGCLPNIHGCLRISCQIDLNWRELAERLALLLHQALYLYWKHPSETPESSHTSKIAINAYVSPSVPHQPSVPHCTSLPPCSPGMPYMPLPLV